MRKICACFLFLFLLVANGVGVAQDSAVKVTVARWPQDRQAAISLTLDDGMDTHLDVAGPILKKHHLHGTFFVSTGLGPWEKRKAEWKLLAREGNELGDHTVNHPCLLEEIKPHSQDYTPEMMNAEIRDAAQEIVKQLNWQRGLTFAYPCGNMSFGPPGDQGRNSPLYLRYVSEYAFGARGAGGGGAQDPDELSVLTVADLGPTDGKDFIGLLALAEPAMRRGHWGVYCFHGVGGEWLPVTSAAFEELAGYLERHSEIWTAPFGDVLRYIQERKAISIEIKQNSGVSVDLDLQWRMDAKIYDLPLTLKVEIPGSWREATATGNGTNLNTKIIDHGESAIILVDVPAQTKAVHIGLAKR